MENYQKGCFYILFQDSQYYFEKKMDALNFYMDKYETGGKWLGYYDGQYFVDRKEPLFILGNYYFLMHTENYPVIISRENLLKAEKTFNLYNNISNNCSWIGMWNGNKFVAMDLLNQPRAAF